MFDLITLSLLWLLTAGTSLLANLLGVWQGGIYWFWFFNCITFVLCGWELYIYKKYGMTMTRLLTKAETDKPKVVKHKWIARLIVISYGLGFLALCIHLWPW